jgi:CzcA family heavy metal efflux pump
MLDRIIYLSLKQRYIVILLWICIAAYGFYAANRMPIDVFPDLNRPTVTLMSEAPGLAPEEVEVLVSRPLEYALNGANGVRRVRSASAAGLSIVWIEFDWGTDIYRDRQMVWEKVQIVQDRLPKGVTPAMTPISSIMGEIMLIALRDSSLQEQSDDATRRDSAMTLRTLAEFDIRNRLLSLDGVSQVSVMGGLLRQFQVLSSPERLAAQNVTLDELTQAVAGANVITGGGIMNKPQSEAMVRISGQVTTLAEIASAPVRWAGNRAIRVADVADVTFGSPVRRGDAASWRKEDGKWTGGSCIILAVQKQPEADTIDLEKRILAALDSLQEDLPLGSKFDTDIFKQSDYIQAAVGNVREALLDGAVWVVVILFLFMWNLRVSISSLIAMPLSILLTIVVFHWSGITLNTMTLGGIAVAIGDLVDDSIVDIENIFRRLKENRQASSPQSSFSVVYQASCEVRGSIVYATAIVVLVVLPLFAMGGLEGRFFAPLGMAYIVSLLCSLVVSLTLTPVLGYFLLPNAPVLASQQDPWILRWLKRLDRVVLTWTLKHSGWVLYATACGFLLTIATLPWMGGEFLPELNEGTLTVNVQAEPGLSLQESNRVAGRVETLIREIPEVRFVARRTGRAELDEHAEGVYSSEIDVGLYDSRIAKPGLLASIMRRLPLVQSWGYEQQGRSREEVFADVREQVSRVPGIRVNVGQPISHRVDHILSGIRAAVVVKLFGRDLSVLRKNAQHLVAELSEVDGVVDLQMEPQIEIPQILLQVDHEKAARYGIAAADLASMLETAYRGKVVSQILQGDRYFDLVVWFDESSRSDPDSMKRLILKTPSGRMVSLGEIADVQMSSGPNTILHDATQRRIAVFCNVEGRSLTSVLSDIEKLVDQQRKELAANGGSYYIALEGQYEAQRIAVIRLMILSAVSSFLIFILLWKGLGHPLAALQVLVNIPLAACGAVIALWLTNFPSWSELASVVWYRWPWLFIEHTELSLAHWVGFITLIGIVSRNGILMISHYMHLMRYEGENFNESMIIRGSLERLAPVMMTAVTSFIGLLPLLSGAGETGKEMLYPLSVVVFGGMLASTLLDQWVTPALFWRFGRPIAEKVISERNSTVRSSLPD